MRVALLNNLRAGRSGAQVSRILSFLRAHPRVLHVETESARALPEAFGELARQSVDLLVLNGGDGTIQHALTEILGRGSFDRVPLIAPLRGGRTNMAAMDLGAHRDPVKGLAAVLDAVRSGTIGERLVERPVLRVWSANRREAHYGMFFGAGMIHRAIALTHRIFPPGRSQGTFGAGLVTATLILRASLRPKEGVLTPDTVKILLDRETVRQGEFYLIIASPLNRLFLKMNPYWGREPHPIRFTCIAANAKRTRAAFVGILRGRPKPFVTPENGYTSRNVERGELGLDCGFTVDGEIFPPQPDEVVTLTADRRVTFVRA